MTTDNTGKTSERFTVQSLHMPVAVVQCLILGTLGPCLLGIGWGWPLEICPSHVTLQNLGILGQAVCWKNLIPHILPFMINQGCWKQQGLIGYQLPPISDPH